jgi:DNA-binding transcriptional ArsR family regulator
MSIRTSAEATGRTGANDAELDAIFSALSDRTRRRILARLSRSAATIGELASPFSMSLPAVSKHVRILEQAGLLRRERNGWYHHCHLLGRPLATAGEFIDRYRSFWEQTLDELARYAETDSIAVRPEAAKTTKRGKRRRREQRG